MRFYYLISTIKELILVKIIPNLILFILLFIIISVIAIGVNLTKLEYIPYHTYN